MRGAFLTGFPFDAMNPLFSHLGIHSRKPGGECQGEKHIALRARQPPQYEFLQLMLTESS